MTETVQVQESKFKIETMDDLRNILVIAKGGDPNAIQAITNFMDLKSNSERTYFPDRIAVLCDAQLRGYGKIFYPNDDWDPYTVIADFISTSSMGYKGFKSNQVMEITRQTPNLSDLQITTAEAKQGLLSRFLGDKKE